MAKIGIVGGLERCEAGYREIVARAGHAVAFHSGRVGGRGVDTLVALARNVDLLIVVTDVNSHGAVHLARREGRQRGVPVYLYRRFSPARLQAIVAGADLPLSLIPTRASSTLD